MIDYSRMNELASPFDSAGRAADAYDKLLAAFAGEEVGEGTLRAAVAFRYGRAGATELPRPLGAIVAAAAPVFGSVKARRSADAVLALRAALGHALGPDRTVDAAWLVHLAAPEQAWPIDESSLRAHRFGATDRTVAQLEYSQEVDLLANDPRSWTEVDKYERWCATERAPRDFHTRLTLFQFWHALGKKLRDDLKAKIGYRDNVRLNRGLEQGFGLRHPDQPTRELALDGGDKLLVTGDFSTGYQMGHGERRRFIPAGDVRDLLEVMRGKTIPLAELERWIVKGPRERPFAPDLAAILVSDGLATLATDQLTVA